MSLVSVVIPAYNCDRYLPQAIASVQQQTYPHWEIIVIDDGSTDQTQAAIAPYRSDIRYVYQKNQGVSAARNHGIELAQGEWIAFLDADDFFFPDKLAAQVAMFYDQPDLGIVHSGWQRVTADGKFIMDVKPWEQVPVLNLESWLRWKPVLPSAMMFRREWLVKAGGFDPRFPPAEDTELTLRLARLGCKADWLKQVTVGYRQHDQSAMSKGLPQARSLAAVIDDFFSHGDIPEYLRRQESQIRYHTLVWIAWYLYTSGHPTEMREYLERAIPHSPYVGIEMLIHWGDSFDGFSRSWGMEFDASGLAQSQEWRNWIRAIAAAWQKQRVPITEAHPELI